MNRQNKDLTAMKRFFEKLKTIFPLLIFLLVFSKGYTQNLSVNPTIVKFSLNNPGSTETQILNISNNSDETQAVELYFGDWIREESGKHTYFEAGTIPSSCSKWISFPFNYVELEPGESMEVPVTLTAPEKREDLEKMKWSMLYVQNAKVNKLNQKVREGMNTQINEIVRMGIHIYQIPSKLSLKSAKVLNLTVNPDILNSYNLQFENDGEVMVKAVSFLELTNISTGEEFRSQIEETPVFPFSRRTVSLHLPENLPKGEYSMLAVLDYGNPDSLEALEKVIEIK